MSKVGRNDPCPCGSGKKYKNCHWGSDEIALLLPNAARQVKSLSFADKVRNYHAMPILRLISYLQLIPENHGRNFSLEIMAGDVLRQIPVNDKRAKMTWEELCQAITIGDNYGDEDTENLFTENIISANGNQTVFPGVYRNGSSIVNELLEVILTGENILPDAFKPPDL